MRANMYYTPFSFDCCFLDMRLMNSTRIMVERNTELTVHIKPKLCSQRFERG